ncbi:MAG TPA: hypothetical protein PKI46_02990 [Bacteroidales bacterium]|nr:hypothetical protein [Bacteroidales bacterium]
MFKIKFISSKNTDNKTIDNKNQINIKHDKLKIIYKKLKDWMNLDYITCEHLSEMIIEIDNEITKLNGGNNNEKK